ncbi:MAG: flippase [Eubacteriales bacterium]
MSTKSIKKNYLFNTVYQILSLLTPLLTTPYISRVLGPEAIGEYSFTSSIVSYFCLFAVMGSGIYGQREISYVSNDKEKRSKVFWEVLCIRFVTTSIMLIIYGIFIYVQESRLLYAIQAITMLTIITDITWLFLGMEEFGKIVMRNVGLKIANILFIFIAIHEQEDLWLYVFGMCLFSFINAIVLWGYLPKYIKPPVLKKLEIKKHLKPIWLLFIPTIAIQIYTVLDKTMIGIFAVSSAENGFYEQALKLSKIMLTLVTSLGTVVIPRIGFLFADGQKEKVNHLMYRSYQFVWFLGIPIYLGVVGVAKNMVPWFYGAGYDKVVYLLYILGFLILAIGINNVTGMQYMIPTKRHNLFTITVCIGAIINFIFNLILIPRFYSIGAAISSVLAESVIAIVQLYIVRKEFQIQRILKLSWNYIIAGSIMLGTLLAIERQLEPSMINTGILVVCGASVYFIILIVLKDSFFIENTNKVFRKKLLKK